MSAPKTVNIHAAKTHFSRLVEQASRGTEIIIARAGRPVARLGPLAPTPRRRRPGLLRGRIRISADFDAPLPAQVVDARQGSTSCRFWDVTRSVCRRSRGIIGIRSTV